MLIDRIIKYSNKQFLIYGDKCGNTFCNHPSGKCSGSCYNCLYQIHFPGRFDGQSPKEKYDCPKMLKQMKIDRGEYALHAEDLKDF